MCQYLSFVESIGSKISRRYQSAAYTGAKAAQPSSCSQCELHRAQRPAFTLRQVRALVRGRDQAALEAIPQSVAVVRGDIGSYDDCLRAMQVRCPDQCPHQPCIRVHAVPQLSHTHATPCERSAGETAESSRFPDMSGGNALLRGALLALQGCDKIISCVSARSDLTVDLKRVEEQGIQNLARAYMVRVLNWCHDSVSKAAMAAATVRGPGALRLVGACCRSTGDIPLSTWAQAVSTQH